MRVFKLTEFSEIWINASKSTAKGITWRSARGLASVALLEFKRLNWTALSATKWADDLGTTVSLTACSPVLVAKYAHASVLRSLERVLAERSGDPARIAERPSLEVVSRLTRAKATTNVDKGLAAQLRLTLFGREIA